ncbi:hypothetical protein QQM79_06465 [Marinobacteraceae bacterium S3BR75-40.1]
MSREKLLKTQPRSPNARRLRELMLDYHAFRNERRNYPLRPQLDALAQWQAGRLRETHADLYRSPAYQEGLDFLLEDLYDTSNFERRDDDVERVFPVMVRMLPDSALYTVARLVELNLLSQKLDMELADILFAEMAADVINPDNYAEAYRRSDRHQDRLHQIQLVANIGDDLQTYVESRTLRFALRVTERPAEMAGLGKLHGFLRRGMHAFRAMGDVDKLLSRIIERETWVLEQMMAGNALPVTLPPNFYAANHL